MIKTIYIEDEIRDHPITEKILARFPQINTISCDRYGEIFNRKAQNFRLQKRQAALILAQKHQAFVLKAPDDYGIDGQNNYYFSHMLNCLYDCRYCFLQGMYQSAHYVLFVNYEGFAKAIDEKLTQHAGEKVWFYSGYDCDSLALDPISKFADFILPFFRERPLAQLELRTKSTQIRSLLKSPALDNCIVAFSLSTEKISQTLEHKTPSLNSRLEAMRKLQNAGWKVALRFEPLIYSDDFKQNYNNLIEQVFQNLQIEKLHSISLGSFRIPKNYFKKIVKLYPEEKLFAGPLQESNGMVAYQSRLEEQMIDDCNSLIKKHAPNIHLYRCG